MLKEIRLLSLFSLFEGLKQVTQYLADLVAHQAAPSAMRAAAASRGTRPL